MSKFFNYMTDDGMDIRPVKLATHVIIGLVLAVTLLFQFPLGTVKAGHRGVMLQFNAVTDEVLDEGLYFRIPFVQKVVKMNVQIVKDEVPANAASADLQDVSSVVALNYHLDPASVGRIYQEVRKNYGSVIIAPALQESVKATTALFTAEELITKRSEVREGIKTTLAEKLAPRGITLVDLNIVDFEFSASFNAAIEDKVTAEQEALAAQNRLETVKFEAQQAIESAKGRAEAIRVEADALQNNVQLLELRAIERWNGVLPATMAGGAVPFISL